MKIGTKISSLGQTSIEHIQRTWLIVVTILVVAMYRGRVVGNDSKLEEYPPDDALLKIPSEPTLGMMEPGITAKAWGFIDRSGKQVATPRWRYTNGLWHGLARVYKGGLEGIVDQHGKVLLEPRWELIGDFVNGVASAKTDGKREVRGQVLLLTLRNHTALLSE